ncbi:UDP-glucose:glycoprotein glucosyltransferase [Seminavis robusta]|uniref:UDP-glucose:glycoprotein glucosyltransferase n=1 Tax=Seminavis robusta TaxID=568900 RepID=A0A9N8H5C1_9STRA|nr:UDP-glucose:glycoprotein glucosyltransferase [Seminavis robusta]|eukprot:Sro82_g044070.1 UDP-glucose:glycoprotein glucosyltransferase (1743) ;mRNA; f:106031-111345
MRKPQPKMLLLQTLLWGVLLLQLINSCHAAPWFGSLSSESEPVQEEPEEDVSMLVSPILNRELETSVVANSWPSNPQNVFCEAYAHHQTTYSNDGPRQELSLQERTAAIATNQQFLSRLADKLLASDEQSSFQSYHDATQFVLETVGGNNNNNKLLAYALAMRAYSPQCELHRGLARQTLHQLHALATFGDRQAFAVVYPGGALALQEELPTADWSALSHTVVTTDADDDYLPHVLLPGEFPFGRDNSNNPQILVVLYANLGSTAFAHAYQKLLADTTASATTTNIRFVVRHLGAVHYEEIGPDETTSPTVLQGYGVRLDIRNVEYKVFDDRKTAGDDEGEETFLNLTSATDLKTPPQFLAGVNLQALGLDDVQVEDDDNSSSLLKELWKKHEAQQANLIPPNWQRRKLPLQATTVIAASKDPLMTLEEVSLNLPSVASTLVHLHVAEDVQEIAEKFEEELASILPQGGGTLLVNGRQINLGRPTFNIFELLNLLRKEQASLERLQSELGPYLGSTAVLAKVKEAWTMGDDFLDLTNERDEDTSSETESKVFRIDVGRGWKRAVMYMNDIEKDAKYAQWPRSVRQMFMAMQFGMPPSIRRNLFTVLVVLDPVEDDTDNVGMTLGKQLMQGNYPARLGMLLVGAKDVKACAEWVTANPDSDEGEPCPIFDDKPILEVATKDKDKLEAIPASTRALHRLVADLIASDNPNDLIDAYMEYMMKGLEEQKELAGQCTLYDLLQTHASTMSGMGMGSTSKHMTKALDLLSKAEESDDATRPTYGKALRFAVDKGLRPGMSFVNGRPMPEGDPQDVFDKAGKIFNQEMQNIAMLIQSGEIKDSTPKSVYGFFLSGKGVYKSVHPLLMDSREKSESYFKVPHEFDASSLLIASSTTEDQEVKAVFVIDALLDVGTAQGIQLAKSLVSVMSTFKTAISDSTGSKKIEAKIGYRIIPSKATEGAKQLCPILAMAGEIGSEALLAVLDKAAEGEGLSLESLLDNIPGLSNDLKQSMEANLSEGVCSRLETVTSAPSDNMIVSNGLFYALEASSVTKDDIELLISLDLDYSKAVTAYLADDIAPETPEKCDAIARTISYLAMESAVASFARLGLEDDVNDLEKKYKLEKNPLRYSWNDGGDDVLQLKITAFVDPTSETCQRLAPLLRVLRDALNLPVTLVLTPRTILDADGKAPITSFYRFVADPLALQDSSPPKALFSNLPMEHTLTLRMDVPESWDVQQSNVAQDTDNLRCDVRSGCSDDAHMGLADESIPIHQRDHITHVEFGLNSLLIFGQCYETKGSSPNGLQLTLTRKEDLHLDLPKADAPQDVEVGMDGTVHTADTMVPGIEDETDTETAIPHADTLVMKTVGYWQLRANPGVWKVQIAKDSKGAEIFDIVDGIVRRGQLKVLGKLADNTTKQVVMKDFVNRGELLLVQRRKGHEKAKLFSSDALSKSEDEDEVINVFSLATGHLYERFLKIMMLSVTRRTSTKVKFWLFENFLSPSFKSSARYMAAQIGCEVEFVTYKWPEWLRDQSEKQRIIWGYKILFLDVLFPLSVKKIIYVDADQVVRGDLKELWDMDLEGAPYGYTPMCSSRESTLGFQFWRGGFWESHLRGRPYHISALYVVDLQRFRKQLVGDQLRSVYQQLSADPNSLANLDQDLPNYAQHSVPIFSLPQEWLWCESWCSDETKATAKTIDLCNNPLHKEPKVSMAKRVISGPLFEESWVELDEVVDGYQKEWQASTLSDASSSAEA